MSPNVSASGVRWFMSEEIRDLIALIRAHYRRLETVCRSVENALDHQLEQRVGPEPAGR